MAKKISRAVKGRIRELIAHELRVRLTEIPEYALTESPELQAAWPSYVCEIADQITPRR